MYIRDGRKCVLNDYWNVLIGKTFRKCISVRASGIRVGWLVGRRSHSHSYCVSVHLPSPAMMDKGMCRKIIHVSSLAIPGDKRRNVSSQQYCSKLRAEKNWSILERGGAGCQYIGPLPNILRSVFGIGRKLNKKLNWWRQFILKLLSSNMHLRLLPLKSGYDKYYYRKRTHNFMGLS